MFSAMKRVSTFDENYQLNAAKSSVYLMMQRFGVKFFSFFKTIVLARLLFPSDFGLFGLATLIIASVEALTQTGYAQALIHKKEVSDEELSAVWTFQLIWYCVLGLVTMIVLAPLSNKVFNNEFLPILVFWMSLMLIIRAFDNTGMTMWLKEMRYDKQFWYDIIPAIAEIVIAIVLAYILRNVWALVISTLAGRVFSLVASYVFHPFRPRITLSWKLLSPFLKYGKWLGLAGIISFIASRFDQLVLGANLSTTDLGHYVMALTLGTLPATELAKAFSTILFPLYSKYASKKDQLLIVYDKVTRVISSIALPATLGLFVLAGNFVLVIYGPKWLATTLIVKLFCLLGIVKTIDYLINPLTLGSGKSKIAVLNSAIIAFVSLVFSVPAVKSYGLLGAVSVLLFGQIIAVIINNFALSYKLKWRVVDIYKPLIVPLLSSVFMAIILELFKDLLPNNIFGLIIKVGVGATSYLIIIFVLDRLLGHESLFKSWLWLKKNLVG
jgi:lipopolysaccharide exporter